MDKFDRIYALHGILEKAHGPVSTVDLEQRLACSQADLENIVNAMRLYLNAPIKFDSTSNGYYYENLSSQIFQLPRLWFNASELHALLTTFQLLSDVEPGILDLHIAPLKEKIIKLLHHANAGDEQIHKRVRLLKIASRRNNPQQFNTVASALLMRKRLHIRYKGRGKNIETQRSVSPQRLVHYRDNWYLDAWCHQRRALRNFSLDRVLNADIEVEAAKEIDTARLDEHFSTAYGIFSGKPKHKAVLRFNKIIARWVADEVWHPDQHGQFELDGSYTLEIPYSDPRELIMDILKYGEDVEVISPDSLKMRIIEKIAQMSKMYQASIKSDFA